MITVKALMQTHFEFHYDYYAWYAEAKKLQTEVKVTALWTHRMTVIND